ALERWLRRDGSGLRFVPRSHPTVSLTLIAALRRGDAVALQGDRALGNRGDVLIPFFGRPAPFPVGPFHLARAAGVPVLPAFCTLDGDRRYALRVLPPMTITRGHEEEALAAWVGTLEQIVAAKPTQWFNFFDVWNPLGQGAGGSSWRKPSDGRASSPRSCRPASALRSRARSSGPRPSTTNTS